MATPLADGRWRRPTGEQGRRGVEVLVFDDGVDDLVEKLRVELMKLKGEEEGGGGILCGGVAGRIRSCGGGIKGDGG